MSDRVNILYHTFGKVHSTKGGTERATVTVATALSKYFDTRVFSIYEEQAQVPMEDCFIDEIHWKTSRDSAKNIRRIRAILVQNKIDCVIIQGSFIHVPVFTEASNGTGCRVIFAHHFAPSWELEFTKLKEVIRKRPSSLTGMARWIKSIVVYPYNFTRNKVRLSAAYRAAYECADALVLLSSSYVEPYKEFAGLVDANKFRVIPNALSFDRVPNFNESSKNKVVLIVARLDETSKRLSLALKIWSLVKREESSKGWVLRIVGEGRDLKRYERIVKKQSIPDVYFEGRQNPVPYYEEASIFLMTSRSESWGMTLTEAQQMGVVPLAFETYSSLKEIITDGENGLIIPERDIDAYVNRLMELMSNDSLRKQLAKQAVDSSLRFSSERIARLWWEIISRKAG